MVPIDGAGAIEADGALLVVVEAAGASGGAASTVEAIGASKAKAM
jgi:hypothetical protein